MVNSQRVAPKLDGYQVRRLLGSGGFADVYLYGQLLPRRDVAIKVLHDGVSPNAARIFTHEANVMAQLSAHPTIVTIYHAAFADDGRPYLVMEYYPNPNLSIRCKSKPFRVDEALDVTIRIAGAVETAHRAGIIHRDIKPANVLISAYGKPGLTDFGIAAAKVDMEGSETGLSIPWSAREVVNDPGAADERSDVYSLAATAYTLLAGSSPYEVPGKRNTPLDLVSRISAGRVPQLDRPDVPSSLRRAISMGMDPDPDRRPATAKEFAVMLQEVEVTLHLPVTSLDLLSGADGASADERDEDATRLRGGTVVNPASRGSVRSTMISGVPETPAAQSDLRPRQRAPMEFQAQNTIRRGAKEQGAAAAGQTSAVTRGGVRIVLIGALLALLTASGALIAAVVTGDDSTPAASVASDEPAAEQDALVLSVPSPTDLAITRTSETTARATWQAPDPQSGDSFQWQRVDPGAPSPARGMTDQPLLELTELVPGTPACLNVWLVRKGIASGEPAQACG